MEHSTRMKKKSDAEREKLNENDYLMSVYKLGVSISLCFPNCNVPLLFNVRKKKVVSCLFFFTLGQRFSFWFVCSLKRSISALNRKSFAKKLAFFSRWTNNIHTKNEWLLSLLLSFAHTKCLLDSSSEQNGSFISKNPGTKRIFRCKWIYFSSYSFLLFNSDHKYFCTTQNHNECQCFRSTKYTLVKKWHLRIYKTIGEKNQHTNFATSSKSILRFTIRLKWDFIEKFSRATNSRW